jgi:hypothetical protein
MVRKKLSLTPNYVIQFIGEFEDKFNDAEYCFEDRRLVSEFSSMNNSIQNEEE